MSTLLARGHYVYHLDGVLQPIEEPWQIWTRAGGKLLLAGERRVQGCAVLRVVARYQGVTCQSLRLRWQSHPHQAPRYWHYHRDDSGLQARGPQGIRTAIETATKFDLFPLLRAATGALLQRLHTETTHIVTPDIGCPATHPGFLHPTLSARSARRLEGTDEDPARWIFQGGPYGTRGAEFTLHRCGIPNRYSWHDGDQHWGCTADAFWCAEDFRHWQPAARSR